MLPFALLTARSLLRPAQIRKAVFDITRTMTTAEKLEHERLSWQDEKKRYLSMSYIDRRKEYKCGEFFYTPKDIKTWREYVLDTTFKTERLQVLPGVKLNAALNEKLAEKVSLFRGDITTLEIDVIVNAANKKLSGGGGVDGAIHRAAGPYLLAENRTLNGCNVGEVKITGGYQLPAKFVFATVGPQGEKPEQLRSCYRRSMELLVEKRLKTIAFPCISTGIYGYPLKPAAHIAVREVRNHLEEYHELVDRVVFCLFSEMDEEIYEGVLQSYFPLM